MSNYALLFTFNPITGYQYIQANSISSYVMQAGDYVQYDVYIDVNAQLDGHCGFDISFIGGLTLRDSGAHDQNGITPHPSQDLRSRALGQWYSRKIQVPLGLIGLTSNQWFFAHDGTVSGMMHVYFKNIRITDINDVLRKDVWIAPDINPTFSLILQSGGNNWQEMAVPEDTTTFKTMNFTYSRDGGKILTRNGIAITTSRDGGKILSRDGIGVIKTR